MGLQGMNNTNQKNGIIYALFAYLIWGFLPIYWKSLEGITAGPILAHRIIWAFLLLLIIILVTKQFRGFVKSIKDVFNSKKVLIILFSASIIISFNWLIYIWAVQNAHVIQTSLGYYINPLLNVVLGMLFLKERLSKAQTLSVALAAVGVLYLTISYGQFPWIALILASTFAVYGLLKKLITLNPIFSLTIETLFIAPIALIYLTFFNDSDTAFLALTPMTITLLIGGGVVTAVPLLLFGKAVQHISLSMAGILQYLAPTLILLIGVFLYDEPFTQAHLFAFVFIWSALIIYMISSIKQNSHKSKHSKLS